MAEASNQSAGYAEEAPLAALFDAPAKTKLLSVFVAERGRDLSKSDLARMAGLSRQSVYEHLPDLESMDVVEHVRTTQDGHSPRYQLNEDSEIASLLVKLEGATLRQLLEETD